MEESHVVFGYNNQVVFSPANENEISSGGSVGSKSMSMNSIVTTSTTAAITDHHSHAVEMNTNNNSNNNNVVVDWIDPVKFNHMKESEYLEDDVTSCASDYESSSSFTSIVQGSRDSFGMFHSNVHSSSEETTRSKSPRDDMVRNHNNHLSDEKSNYGDRHSYHLDFDLSREVGKDIYDISDLKSVAKFAYARIEAGLEKESFLITNLGAVINQYHLWKTELPMVKPFYAVKCNPDTAIVRLLAALGCGFDCATQGEIDLVLHGLGEELSFGPRNLASTSIVYANPAHMVHHLQYAINNGVRMTVFDSEDELEKIASLPNHENLELLLRLTTDDRASICQFSKKFGCPVRDAPHLLCVAKSLGLDVAGVSFHVGSGCGDPNAYVIALDHARQVFDTAEEYGMKPLYIIDIGGGFPGDAGGYGGPNMPTFQDLASAVRSGLDNFATGLHRPMSEIRILAEPGRFFVSSCTCVATKIYSRKGGYGNTQALYVDDGVYGTFNNIVYDHATPIPLKLSTLVTPSLSSSNKEDCEVAVVEPSLPTIVFGPTCDGLDQLCSLDKTRLPRCEVGDWLYWENMGAYTHTASFLFNGYTHVPQRCYCYLEDTRV